MKVEFEEPYILIYDKKISSTNEILPVLEAVSRERKPLLIIAEDIEGEALTTLVVNNLRGIIQVCAIKAPGFGERRKSMLQDIAVLTGGYLIDEEIGMKLELATIDTLGMARSVKIDSSTTTIIDGYGEAEKIEERVASIRREIDAATSDYDREKQQERLAKLAGGVAVIHVGAITEVELKEKKHRVEDAICSTRSAIEEGIVPGGGSTLCHISTMLDPSTIEDEEERIGYSIVKRAILKPIKQIAENAGIDGSIIAYKCSELGNDMGYDAYHGRWVNMIDTGIIDPKKVVRCAIQNASSVASLVLTSSCAITNLPEKHDCSCGSQQPMMM
jgi:chaperonin GroEL